MEIMFQKARFFTLYTFIFFSTILAAQNNRLDSLNNIIKGKFEDTAKVSALLEVGMIYYRTVSSDTAFVYFEKAKKYIDKISYKKGLSKYYLYCGSVKKQIRMTKEAVEDFRKSAKIASELGLRNLVGKAYVSLGGALTDLGEYKEALEFLNKGMQIRKELKDSLGIADSYNMLGIYYYYQNMLGDALENFLESMRIKEKIGNRSNLSESYNNVGIMYKTQGNLEKALEYFQKSLQLRIEFKQVNNYASSYNNIGVIYEEMGEPLKAREYYQKAVKHARDIGDIGAESQYLGNMGAVSIRLRDFNKALEYLLEAKKIHEEKLSRKADLCTILGNIGSCYFELKDFEKAKEYGEKQYAMAKELNLQEPYVRSLNLQAEICYAQKDYKKAFEFFREYKLLDDSLKKATRLDELRKMTSQYDLDKQKESYEFAAAKEHLRLEAEKKTRNLIVIASIVGFLLMGTVLFLSYRSYRIKKKASQQLEAQNKEITHQKVLIEEKNKDITDSILYAQRIQQALLPDEDDIRVSFPDSFVLFKPRDIVSGDFYWHTRVGNYAVVAVADCTGHGVPGAFMSMIGHDLLNQIVGDESITTPSSALAAMDRKISNTLNKQGSDKSYHDGMDIALCAFNLKKNELQFSGALRPLLLIRNKEMQDFRPDKHSIGGASSGYVKNFTDKTLEFRKGDCFYLFSDGFADQFGGAKGKKFMNRKLKELLFSIHEKTMIQQKQILEKAFEEWRGSHAQVDDVCVIGIRV